MATKKHGTPRSQPERELPKKERSPRLQDKPDATAQTSFWTRNKALAAIGITAATALAYGYSQQKSPATPDTPHVQDEKEVTDKKEITLGNVTFQLQNSEKISPQERVKLFATMEKAYAKLKTYFDEEIMTLVDPYTCAVNVEQKTKQELKNGLTTWDTQYSLNQQSGDLEFSKPSSVSLKLWSTAEDIIAHEFVHLFVQPVGVLSQAFYEGHAHSIQKILYGDQVYKGEANKIMEKPNAKHLFNIGLDYSQFESSALKGGVQDHTLELLLKVKWEGEWNEFLKDNPDFFKKFYKEISKMKKQGKVTFSKKELLEIAQTVSVNFNDWYTKRAISMKEIGEKGAETEVEAADMLAKNTVVIANIQTVPKELGQKLIPPKLKPAMEGPIQITISSTINGQTQTVTPVKVAPYFIVIDIPGNMSTSKIEKITIGGKEIPIKK